MPGGTRGFVAWLWPVHSAMLNHVHTIGNVTIDAAGPDAAVTEAQVRVTLRFQQGDVTVDPVGLGRYLDRWKHDRGRWVINERTYVSDMVNVRDVSTRDVDEQLRRSPDARRIVGARDSTDPSYAVLP